MTGWNGKATFICCTRFIALLLMSNIYFTVFKISDMFMGLLFHEMGFNFVRTMYLHFVSKVSLFNIRVHSIQKYITLFKIYAIYFNGITN